jgi:thioredoxin reductase
MSATFTGRAAKRPKRLTMNTDAIVVGASFAGLSAAMQLARARKRVLVIDAGKPRNRFSDASHGFLGQDGVAPLEIMRTGARQLAAYPSVSFVHGEAVQATATPGGFRLDLADGSSHEARRLVLATGVRDELPAVPGLAERWGKTVLHCPYCHGYEVAGHPLGVLANHAVSAHQAALIPEWGPTTLFTQGRFEPDADHLATMLSRGATIERTPVVELLGNAPELAGVRLADGRVVAVRALFTAPRTHMSSPLAEQLGCAFEDGPVGPYIRVNERKETSVPGVFAAGDAASPMYNATIASAAGVMAGLGAHHSLME